MSAIEESLRRALEGGDPSDPVFRQTIYAASERALERMIEGRGLDEERAEVERARLAATMERVEAEYAGYYQGEAGYAEGGPSPQPSGEGDHWSGEPEAWEGDESAAGRAPSSYSAPPAGEPEPQTDMWAPGGAHPGERRRRPRGRRRTLALAIALLVLVGALVFGLLRLFEPAAEEPAPPLTTGEAGDPPATPAAAPTQDITWINVFSGDLEQIATPSGGRVSGIADAEREAVRLSGPEDAEAEILISLGPGLVGELAGSNVRVELVAGSPDSELREFSVRCLFGEDSICDRQRFATNMREEAFVFDVSIPADVSTPASLAIGPGLSPDGPDVDLYSVRIRVL